MSSAASAVDLLQSQPRSEEWLAAAIKRFNLTETTVAMFFENEVTRTLTVIEFLLVVIIGLAPVALTIWMKLVLYRRRVAEGERDSLPRADRQSREAGRAGVFSARHCPAILPSSRITHGPPLPATFDRNKPLGLFAVNPAAKNLKSENEKEERNHLLST